MTLFIKLENGQPVGNPITELTFRRLFTDTSFPKFFTADAVEPLGYGLYDYSNQPKLGRYQKAVEVTPVRSGTGIWRQTWQVVEMDATEKSEADSQQASIIREKRNYLLSQTDWTMLDDSPLTADEAPAFFLYRQALRDITKHANFPYLADGDWPVEPVWR